MYSVGHLHKCIRHFDVAHCFIKGLEGILTLIGRHFCRCTSSLVLFGDTKSEY